jgi:hypothetical protein
VCPRSRGWRFTWKKNGGSWLPGQASRANCRAESCATGSDWKLQAPPTGLKEWAAVCQALHDGKQQVFHLQKYSTRPDDSNSSKRM